MNVFGFDTDKSWDYENGFYLTSHPTRLAKMAAHYELYKSIIHLPGHVVECGVYKGTSLIRFCTFRDMLESSHSRRIIGFDAFGQFPVQGDEEDRRFISHFEGQGGPGVSLSDMQAVIEHKRLQNCELIEGDICQTVPAYVETHPELKIALLHVDVDVYDPTMTILRELYDRVVPGGLVVMDDYGTVAGETRAVDEFFAGQGVAIHKLPISHIPSFIRK